MRRCIENWLRTSGHDDDVDLEQDIEDHLNVRIQSDRLTTIPWIERAKKLAGARVLEVGAGSGTSTIAFAEQGALVTPIDIDDPSLEVARTRYSLYEMNIVPRCMNAIQIEREFGTSIFDIVVFFASMEHMTHEERQLSLKAAWAALKPGGVLCVTGTINRLWHYDFHTSRLPFFNWLPDELAMAVAHKSPRKMFAEASLDELTLARWGRGFSYHEIELALGELSALQVLESRADFIRRRSPLLFLESLVSKSRRYEKTLEALYPSIHPAFFRLFVDVQIVKH